MSYLEGHRQRLRDRFNASGLGAFEDHEVLELLLTYAVPRKDVKPIGRALLDRFGSLSNALDAATVDLTSVEGVGENGATLLHLMPALTRRYLRDRWGHKPQLATREDIARFAVDELATANNEVFLLIVLTHENHVLRALPLHEGTITSAPVYPAPRRRGCATAPRREGRPRPQPSRRRAAQPSDEDRRRSPARSCRCVRRAGCPRRRPRHRRRPPHLQHGRRRPGSRPAATLPSQEPRHEHDHDREETWCSRARCGPSRSACSASTTTAR
jgi:hypothetical protein